MNYSKELTINAVENKSIAVIGAGFFGIMTALKLAERGFNVVIFEKNNEIIRGASYINQNRVHFGYHYPRSDDTAKSSFMYQKAFCKLFKESVVTNFEHYYCIARENSLTTGQQYRDFCNRLNLPYTEEFPKKITMSHDKVEMCIKVPEHIYDANVLRGLLKNLLKDEDRINLFLLTEVIGINNKSSGFEIEIKKNNKTEKLNFDAIINATYNNINRVIAMAGFETKNYQYELCEVPIVHVPWKDRLGCGIMDGPFFGILPFGFSDEYMLYDVEISVLERSVSKLPEFKHDIDYYNEKERREKRFQKYIEKSKEYIKEMDKCQYLYSAYIVRVVLPNRDKDDARPTEILYHKDAFWSIFSGKLSAAIPASEKITEEVDDYFRKRG